MTPRWQVQALENKAGTGWHVTYHPTLEAAQAMVAIRFNEPGISTAKITRETQPWTNPTSYAEAPVEP